LGEADLSYQLFARETAGADVELMLDVNCAWSLTEARKRAEALKEFHLKWLEEAIWSPENYDGLADLLRTCGIPIAAGENVHTLMDFERLMKAGAVDFVQPSPAKAGSVSGPSKVYSIAAVRNVAVMLHSFYDGPGLLAAIHAAAALGAAEAMIEWRVFDLEAQVYAGALAPKDSRISAPQKPGLGIEPDLHVIQRFLMI
jgi:L-alanine-DL-glutamate epimerase-like enolase superfamily enzyme